MVKHGIGGHKVSIDIQKVVLPCQFQAALTSSTLLHLGIAQVSSALRSTATKVRTSVIVWSRVTPHEIHAGSRVFVICWMAQLVILRCDRTSILIPMFRHSSLSISAHYPRHALKTNPPIINIKITKAINQNSFCRFFFESSLSFSNFLII